VSFEIAKSGEEKLLFNLISDGIDFTDVFSLTKFEGLNRIEGTDKNEREIVVSGLFAKDSTVGTKTDSKVILNGYVFKSKDYLDPSGF